jgi:ATP-binding cassette, subfamily B, bacterial
VVIVMDMEVTAWHSMYTAMHATRDRRPFSLATLRRIAGFARPHRRLLAWFVTMSVVAAVLAVATPVLAGRVVDAIVRAEPMGVLLAGHAARAAAAPGVRDPRPPDGRPARPAAA